MSQREQVIFVTPDGTIAFVWDDDLAKLFAAIAPEGTSSVRRASNVEPDELGMWWVDLSLAGGPKSGPYQLRADAIAEEMKWLKANLGHCSLRKEPFRVEQ